MPPPYATMVDPKVLLCRRTTFGQMPFTPAQAEHADRFCSNTLISHLGIRFFTDDAGRLCATMPVDERTRQPVGLLHGGATAALAETLGSMGSSLLVDLNAFGVVGIEINANHLRGIRSGQVTAIGELLHQGRTTHVWDIKVYGDEAVLCAVCRLTILIVKLERNAQS